MINPGQSKANLSHRFHFSFARFVNQHRSRRTFPLIQTNKKGAFRLLKFLSVRMVGRDGFEPTYTM